VTDSRNPRDGRFLENIGVYDPRGKQETIDLERVDYWVANGAQPSDTVSAIITRARAGELRTGKAPEAAPVVEEAAPAKAEVAEPAAAAEESTE
jgi:small subunit ribosomal protein S16